MNKEYTVIDGNAVILSDDHLREEKYSSVLENKLTIENNIAILEQEIADKAKALEHLEDGTSKKNLKLIICSLSFFELIILFFSIIILLSFGALGSLFFTMVMQTLLISNIKEFFKYFKDKKKKVFVEEQINYMQSKLSEEEVKLGALNKHQEDLTMGTDKEPINLMAYYEEYKSTLEHKLNLLQAISLIRQNKRIIDKETAIAELLKENKVSQEVGEELTLSRIKN